MDCFVSGSLDGTVRVFDLNKFSQREKFQFESGVTKVWVHESKSVIVASTLDGFIHVFDHRVSDPIKVITGSNCCIHDFALTKKDEILAAGEDGRILLFDLKLN